MRTAEAAFELARQSQTRGAVEQVDCVLADPRTVMVTAYFRGDDEPVTLLIDLDAPMSETDFDYRAMSAALLPAAATIH